MNVFVKSNGRIVCDERPCIAQECDTEMCLACPLCFLEPMILNSDPTLVWFHKKKTEQVLGRVVTID